MINPSAAINMIDFWWAMFHVVLCICIPWSFFGSSFVTTVIAQGGYLNPFVFFGTIATGMRQMMQDFLIELLLPGSVELLNVHLWWLFPVVFAAEAATTTVSTMMTLCFWQMIPSILWGASMFFIGVSLYVQFPTDFTVHHIFVKAWWKLIKPLNHHGAMALIVLFILVMHIVVRLYIIAVVQKWVNAPDMCLEFETRHIIHRSQGFSEYTIRIMYWSRVLCMLHTAAHTVLCFQPTRRKIKTNTITNVTIEGRAHVFEGTMKFKWTSLFCNKDVPKRCLFALGIMITVGWYLWPTRWLQDRCERCQAPGVHGCKWAKCDGIEEPGFSLILQVLACVCCVWLCYFADVAPLSSTHKTFETDTGRQIADVMHSDTFDVWGVLFKSFMSEDMPCAFEHPVHGAAVTFDVSEGRLVLVPFNTTVAWTCYDVVEEFGGPGVSERHSGSERRERGAAEKYGLRALGKHTAAQKK